MNSLDKPSLNELAHFGVLGMKWGVRKDRKVYATPKLQDKVFKKRASQNIEIRVQEKGMSRLASVSIESAKAIVITALLIYGSKKLGSIVGSKLSDTGKLYTETSFSGPDSPFFSNSLGRFLTFEEALAKGL